MTKKTKGFYTKEEKKPKKAPKPKLTNCERCKLCDIVTTPKFPLYGEGNKKILIIRDVPTENEDAMGRPYSGSSGSLIKSCFYKHEINVHDDCWTVYALRCHKKAKDPTVGDINRCREHLEKAIEELKPEKIIAFGKFALLSLIGKRESVTSIDRWRGACIPDQELKCWVYPIHSPLDILSDSKNEPLEKTYKNDVDRAILHDVPFPIFNVKDEHLNLIYTAYGATIYLEGLRGAPIVAFDYETTGIKPHAEGHKIVCVSFSTDGQTAAAFPIFDDADFLRALRKVLQNASIKKIAHNIMFENSWTKNILKYAVKGWHWDTMICQHLIDNRTKVSGLKHQVYVRYGVSGYDDAVASYITSNSKNTNAFNMMDQCPLPECLRYCALDSLFEYRLYEEQKRELMNNDGMDLFMEGALALSEAHEIGISMDMEYYRTQMLHLNRQKERLRNKIMNSPEVASWDKDKYGPFNFNSGPQLKVLLFDILKLKPKKYTKKNSPSTDVEALSDIDVPFIKNLREWKKYDKIQNTYLAGYIRECVNGVLHPNFNLHTTATQRSSSSNVNFQNTPKREVQANRAVRSGIIPRKDRLLVEADYSGIEVCISACYHKDPSMISYIEDDSTDMHRDTARELFVSGDITKEERYLSKNNFVFPQFYGDWYKSCATSLWQKIGPETIEKLNSAGVRTYAQFENHVAQIEAKFWNERFPVYKQWKIDTWELYKKQLFLESYTGFIYPGIMKKNDALNYMIQGSAFHCLLWSFIRIGRALKENKMESLLIGQIHDSVVLDVVPDELPDVKALLNKIMCIEIKKEWNWIIVPLKIEIEVSEINGNWAEMRKEPL